MLLIKLSGTNKCERMVPVGYCDTELMLPHCEEVVTLTFYQPSLSGLQVRNSRIHRVC